MGSFNVSCGVSRLSIGPGTPTVLIPLKQHEDKFNMSGANIVSNYGPMEFFIPYTLPIVGEYDDYGSLENIKKIPATKALERHFGFPIEELVEHITGDPKPKVPELSGMFVHKTIYDALAEGFPDEFGHGNTAWFQSDVTVHLVRSLGFTVTEPKPERERYSLKCVHPKIPELVLWSDGTWVETEYRGKKVNNTGIYHPYNLFAFLTKLKLYIPPQLLKLKGVLPTDVDYACDLEQYLSRKITPDSRIRGCLNELSLHRDGSFYLYKESSMDFDKRFYQYYERLFSDPTFRREVVAYHTFIGSLHNVNTLLMPSYNGMQCGNVHASQALAKTVLDIATAAVKERDDLDAEDAEEE